MGLEDRHSGATFWAGARLPPPRFTPLWEPGDRSHHPCILLTAMRRGPRQSGFPQAARSPVSAGHPSECQLAVRCDRRGSPPVYCGQS
ncbi:hypothetical protein QQF64_010796 [Cirrhinus molitorella]|uniref:Uncharacterized protein n=1 Tax=Cirrhinus molitorella TaxID=172907 RepID=A0ABR3LXE1_9TELE